MNNCTEIFFSRLMVFFFSFSLPSPPHDLFPWLLLSTWSAEPRLSTFCYKCSVLCILMMSSSEAINYKWSSKNWLGSFLFSVVSKRNGSIKGCTICDWNRIEKNRIDLFHLDHNNPLWLSQRDYQRSRKKTLRKNRKNNNNKDVTKPWEDSCPSPNDGWSVRPLG